MKKGFLYIAFFALGSTLLGQDGQFSQYFASPTLINPAVTGVIPEMEFSANYKTGGDENTGTFVELMQASFTYPLKKNNHSREQIGGVGGTFFRENRGYRGLYTSQKLLLTGSYSFKLSEFSNQFLVFGLQGGIVQNQLDNSQLQWGSQFNQFLSSGFDSELPRELLTADAIYYPTFNFGVVYTLFDNDDYFIRDRSLTIGLSADNLNRPITGSNQIGELRKNILFKGFGSSKFQLNARFYLYPSFLVLNYGSQFQTNAGVYLATSVQSPKSKVDVQLHAGSWYRVQDSFIFLAGIQINHIRLSGSLDLNSSEFQSNELYGPLEPSYEISLTYNFITNKSIRRISNPIF